MAEGNDLILRGMLLGRGARFTAISGAKLVETARELHSLSRVCTAALGRTLMMTSMMGVSLKGKGERVTSIVKGGGAAGNIVCTADMTGCVKGYIENPAIELPPSPEGKLDVARAVGRDGGLTVVRDMSLKEPYVGRSPIVSGEIAEDFAHYFTVSEQQPSLVYLGVRVDIETGGVLAAGGMLVQALPGCPEEDVEKLAACAGEITLITRRLEAGETLEEIAASLFEGLDMEILQSYAPEFRCDCSRERLERVLLSLGREELEDMIEKERGAQLTCHFCNAIYNFSEYELRRLIAEGGRIQDDG
ncbi:MAG TPA: Hsp33 family molecular chaperone HslO [Clostridia bacterium]|nr:Hsp33 family molecular chaperone HslO [Clostridia bacterium]